ncbi:MAG: diguanylate cyclase [Gammaproteobacteria bacterium]|nr:diguanylate cyclase [Gammaproteobacteria bacterium]MBU1978393.1 diguanylate cyclase [Gammaproteobacteria bacterium]
MPNSQLTLKKLKTLLDHLHDGVFSIEEGMMVYANQALSTLIGYPLDEILQQPFTCFVYKEDLEKIVSHYQARLQGENVPNEYEFRMLSKQGNAIDVRINVGVSVAPDGLRTSIGTIKDLRETKRTTRDLARSRHDIESILDNMPDVFYRTDLQGLITLMSPSCKEALGYEAEEMIGQPLASFYCTPSERAKILNALEEGKGKARHVEACLTHRDGSAVWISTNAYLRLDENGQAIGVEGIARNISERKELEDKLTAFARIDDLTQVYNRRYFYEEAEKQLILAHRYQRPAAILMLDLDRFKQINDTYGHRAGDEVLKDFAQICRDTIRETDIFGRTGGEEFAVLLPETELDSAFLLAQRICSRVNSSTFKLNQCILSYSVSIGVAIIDSEKINIGKLLSHADKALYEAKEAGRNCVRIYGAEKSESATHMR